MKGIGAGLATIALAGVGAGIGIVFGSLIHSVVPIDLNRKEEIEAAHLFWIG